MKFLGTRRRPHKSTNNLITPTGENICTVPATGFRTVDQDGRRVFSMDIPFPVGVETFISFNIVMTENPESGFRACM